MNETLTDQDRSDLARIEELIAILPQERVKAAAERANAQLAAAHVVEGQPLLSSLLLQPHQQHLALHSEFVLGERRRSGSPASRSWLYAAGWPRYAPTACLVSYRALRC